MIRIGKTLTELRNKKHLTQDQMADALEVKRARYNAWENDISKPSIEMVNKLADFHNVDSDYILGRSTVVKESRATYDAAPSWASPKDIRDFKKMLLEDEKIMWDGVPIEGEDREKAMRLMEAMFWDAKKKNKRKPIDE